MATQTMYNYVLASRSSSCAAAELSLELLMQKCAKAIIELDGNDTAEQVLSRLKDYIEAQKRRAPAPLNDSLLAEAS